MPAPPTLCPERLDLHAVFMGRLSDDGPERLLQLLTLVPADNDPWTERLAPRGVEGVERATLATYGVEPSDAPLWILSGGEPCRVEPGDIYAFTGDSGAAPYTTLVRELRGMCGLPDRGVALALQQRDAPAGCHVAQATSSGRDMPPLDPMPEALRAILDPSTCQAPGCVIEQMHSTLKLPDGFTLIDVMATRYKQGDMGNPDCETAQDLHGAWFRRSATAPWLPFERTRGEVAAIYDARGVRLLETQAAGTFDVFTLNDAGELEPLRSIMWYMPHDEEQRVPNLNPCRVE